MRGPEKGNSARSEHDKDMELHAIIPLLPCGIVAFVTEPGSDFCSRAVRTSGSYDRAGVHGIIAIGNPPLLQFS